MAKVVTAVALAQQLVRDGRKELRRHLLPGAVSITRGMTALSGQPLSVGTPAPVVIPDGHMGKLPGSWTIRMNWDIYADPGEGSARVMMSSLSLSVAEIPLTSPVDRCLVRYDTNRFADAPSRSHSAVHLNVLQPAQLYSKVHYPVFGLDHDMWPVREVLDFFLSEDLQNDLAPLLP